MKSSHQAATRKRKQAAAADPPADPPAPASSAPTWQEPLPGAIETLRRIQSGALLPRSLSAASRRLCVEYLGSEGRSVHEIAAILQVDERTIARDRARVREDNAVAYDPALAARAVGELIRHAGETTAALQRIAREQGASAGNRIKAVRAAWRTHREMFAALQRCGYIPLLGPEVRGELTHTMQGPPPGLIRHQIAELEAAVRDASPENADALQFVQRSRRIVDNLLSHPEASPPPPPPPAPPPEPVQGLRTRRCDDAPDEADLDRRAAEGEESRGAA